MNRREQLHEIHLALEGAVDQMSRAQRLAVAGDHGLEGLDPELDAAFARVAELRNRVREELMRELSRPAPLPSLKKKER